MSKKLKINENFELAWAKQDVIYENRTYGLIKHKQYKIYSKFKTDKMDSGVCYIILSENNRFIGYDSSYFMDEVEYESAKYNL